MSSKSPVIILTGASRGLGLAVLQLLLTKHNARVATLSRSLTAELEAVVKEFGEDRVLPVQGDVSKPEDNTRVVEAATAKWGGLDGLVMNAGTIDPCKVGLLPLDSLIPYVQTNVLSTIYLVQPALPYLRKSQGKVVLVSSGASTTGYQAWGLYSMAKAGMNSLARTLAAEEKDNGVSVFSIRPGMVNMQAHLRTNGPKTMHPSEMVKFTDAHEKGQLLAPELPGAIIAGLAVAGPADLSGEYLNWSDERLSSLS
ncbi:hypothetical protein IAU60_006539 [Kwoniella sp. DSM 27419]